MQLKKLFQMQKELDKHINEKHNLQGQNLMSKKVQAFNVELSELANEVREFKFWSNKGSSPKEVILEEYVDALHFLLSIGLEKEYDKFIEDFKVDHVVKSSFTEEHFHINQLAIVFYNESIKEQHGYNTFDIYSTLLNRYLSMGQHILGFTEEEIFRAYNSKNKINHLRQEEGY